MIQRSLPGYGTLVPLIGLVAAEHFPPGILRPDTPQALEARLTGAGFAKVRTWLQCLSFVSLPAWKP
jgi:hypothetical protein